MAVWRGAACSFAFVAATLGAEAQGVLFVEDPALCPLSAPELEQQVALHMRFTAQADGTDVSAGNRDLTCKAFFTLETLLYVGQPVVFLASCASRDGQVADGKLTFMVWRQEDSVSATWFIGDPQPTKSYRLLQCGA